MSENATDEKSAFVYECPKCKGSAVEWDRALRKPVCPKDKTPLNDYLTDFDKPSSRFFGRRKELLK
jgi:hypothetical protein